MPYSSPAAGRTPPWAFRHDDAVANPDGAFNRYPGDGPASRQSRTAGVRGLPPRRGRRRACRAAGCTPGSTADESPPSFTTSTQRPPTGRSLERAETAERRSLVDGAIAGAALPRFGSPQRGVGASTEPTAISPTRQIFAHPTRRPASNTGASRRPPPRPSPTSCAPPAKPTSSRLLDRSPGRPRRLPAWRPTHPPGAAMRAASPPDACAAVLAACKHRRRTARGLYAQRRATPRHRRRSDRRAAAS